MKNNFNNFIMILALCSEQLLTLLTESLSIFWFHFCIFDMKMKGLAG